MRTRFVIVILTAFFAMLPHMVTAQAADQAEWTLMFYMDSDNNLEAAQM